MSEVTGARLRIADLGVLFAVTMSIGGLIWQASSQAQRLDDNFTQDARRDGEIETLKVAKEDTADRLARIETGVQYLVEQNKREPGK